MTRPDAITRAHQHADAHRIDMAVVSCPLHSGYDDDPFECCPLATKPIIFPAEEIVGIIRPDMPQIFPPIRL